MNQKEQLANFIASANTVHNLEGPAAFSHAVSASAQANMERIITGAMAEKAGAPDPGKEMAAIGEFLEAVCDLAPLHLSEDEAKMYTEMKGKIPDMMAISGKMATSLTESLGEMGKLFKPDNDGPLELFSLRQR